MEHYYQNILPDWFTFSDLYAKMVNDFPDGSHFVEIGSWMGRSAVFMAVEIINSNKKIKFDCIDSWEFIDEIYTSDNNIAKLKLTAFDEFLKNINPVSDIINYHKCKSIDASKLYKDQSLDFVYIDASHEYENVKNDLIYWYPKVTFGGVIAGHDYPYPGVKKAVNEFFENREINTQEISWIHYKN